MIAMVSVWTQAGQTMWIHTGHVHWAYNTESVGTMPYSSANLLTVLDKGKNGDKYISQPYCLIEIS